MVEQDEQINDSGNTERNTFGIKDIHKEATVDNKGQAALSCEKEKAALVMDLGPEIARETNIEEQMKALEEFKKAKQRKDNSAVQPVRQQQIVSTQQFSTTILTASVSWVGSPATHRTHIRAAINHQFLYQLKVTGLLNNT